MRTICNTLDFWSPGSCKEGERKKEWRRIRNRKRGISEKVKKSKDEETE